MSILIINPIEKMISDKKFRTKDLSDPPNITEYKKNRYR